MYLRIRNAALIAVSLAVSLLVPALTIAGGAITPRAPQFVALSVPDAAKSAAWYRQAFGLRVLAEIRPPDGAHIVILSSETLLMEILQLRNARSPGEQAIKDPHLTHGIFKVGFHVPDLDGAVEKLTKLGANFETRIIDDKQHDLRFALLRDPDGNYVQLFGTPKAAGGP